MLPGNCCLHLLGVIVISEKQEQQRSTGEQPGTLLADRPVLFLKVRSGPDAGKTGRFDQASISLGRAKGNDFKLRDLSVSGHHGVFVRTDEGFIFQDVGSTHGSQVTRGTEPEPHLVQTPEEPIAVDRFGILKIGMTEITFEINHLYASSTESGASQLKFEQDEISSLKTMQLPDHDLLLPIAPDDPRLEILFRLGKQLNGLTQLNDILAHIADAAFEALPEASLVAINKSKQGELKPLLVQAREGMGSELPEVVLNKAAVGSVLASGEAMLFAPETTLATREAQPASMCAPLLGQKSQLGVIVVQGREAEVCFDQKDLAWFSVLASSAAFALERASLNQAIYRMFEGFVQASVGAIEARDPTTAGHSQRVAKYALSLIQAVVRTDRGAFSATSFTPGELTELRYAALLHDFGKVCVREEVLMKSARLSDEEMARIQQRFRYLRSENHRKLAESQLRKAFLEAKTPTARVLANLEKHADEFSQELDEAYHLLERLRTKWQLEPDEIQSLRDFGRRRLEGLDGSYMQFLTEREIENITIPIGTLNALEWEEMRAHVVESESFLSRIPWSDDLKAIPAIAGAHHEKLDGSGYPKGLMGEEISLQARILTIADIYDACTAWDRPYCQPIGIDEAVKLLYREAKQNKLDEDLVHLFESDVLPEVKHLAPRL